MDPTVRKRTNPKLITPAHDAETHAAVNALLAIMDNEPQTENNTQLKLADVPNNGPPPLDDVINDISKTIVATQKIIKKRQDSIDIPTQYLKIKDKKVRATKKAQKTPKPPKQIIDKSKKITKPKEKTIKIKKTAKPKEKTPKITKKTPPIIKEPLKPKEKTPKINKTQKPKNTKIKKTPIPVELPPKYSELKTTSTGSQTNTISTQTQVLNKNTTAIQTLPQVLNTILKRKISRQEDICLQKIKKKKQDLIANNLFKKITDQKTQKEIANKILKLFK